MDDYRDVEEARLALLEKIILDAGLHLPGLYEGLHGKELRDHQRKMLDRWAGIHLKVSYGQSKSMDKRLEAPASPSSHTQAEGEVAAPPQCVRVNL